MDEITLRGMAFFGRHGHKPEEKALGQRFVVDVTVRADLRGPGKSDDLGQTIDYGRVYAAVKEVMEGPSLNLIEAAAERICSRVLAISDLVEEVETAVFKPSAPVPGILDGAEVRIVRRRE